MHKLISVLDNTQYNQNIYNRETMVTIEPEFNCQYQFLSFVHMWQNAFQPKGNVL